MIKLIHYEACAVVHYEACAVVHYEACAVGKRAVGIPLEFEFSSRQCNYIIYPVLDHIPMYRMYVWETLTWVVELSMTISRVASSANINMTNNEGKGLQMCRKSLSNHIDLTLTVMICSNMPLFMWILVGKP